MDWKQFTKPAWPGLHFGSELNNGGLISPLGCWRQPGLQPASLRACWLLSHTLLLGYYKAFAYLGSLSWNGLRLRHISDSCTQCAFYPSSQLPVTGGKQGYQWFLWIQSSIFYSCHLWALVLAGIYNVGILSLRQPSETTFFQCYSDISKTHYLQANDTLWLCDRAIQWWLNKGTLV